MGRDASRAKVYSAATDSWGHEAADAVMDLLPPWDHTEPARRSDVESLRVETKSEINEVRTSLDTLRVELKSEINELRVSVESRIENVRTELLGAMDRMFAKLVVVMLSTMFGLGGLILAAVTLA